MSTTLANPAEMIRQGAPHLIHSEEELTQYTAALFELTSKSQLTNEEESAVELLTLLIDRYETREYPLPDAGTAEVLGFLMQQHELSQTELAAELGEPMDIRAVLAGTRELTREQIARLSARFRVEPSVFFPHAEPW